MFASIIELFPAEWRDELTVLSAPLRWIPEWQASLVDSILGSPSLPAAVLASIALLAPVLLLIAGVWCTMVSLYTLPFRAGRRVFLTALIATWWEAGRAVWLFWTGIARVIMVLAGWVVACARFAFLLLRELALGIVRSPLALLDWAWRRFFQPEMPWVAFVVLLAWCGLEAAVLTYTLQPTLNDVFVALTGYQPDPRFMAPMLCALLVALIAASFACIHVAIDAVRSRKPVALVSAALLVGAMMFVQVAFLYREIVDAVVPWVAQRSGGRVLLGLGETLAIASILWAAIRISSWVLFGRYATPALLALFAHRSVRHQEAPSAGALVNRWREPVAALRTETQWFHDEARRMFELLSLPVLELLAAAINFAVVTVQSRPMFILPFRTMDDMMSAVASHTRASSLTPLAEAKAERGWTPGVRTPRDPMTAVAS